MTEDKNPPTTKAGIFLFLGKRKKKGALPTFPPPRLRLLDWFRI